MKQKNFFRFLSVSLVTILFPMNVWADRGSLHSSKYVQILDPESKPISKYITGTTMTFETWIYLDDIAQADGMMVYNNGFQFGFTGGQLIFQNFGAGRTVNVWLAYKTSPQWSDLTAGRWLHLALVVDGNNWKAYLDGTVRYDQNLAGGYNNNTTNYYITGDPWKAFAGKMAEVRVWNVARTQAEIFSNMRKILPESESNLVARINFAEGTGGKSQNLTSIGGGAWPGSGVTMTWGVVSATPTNLQTPEITSNGFTLTWDGGPETEYKIALTNTSTLSTTYYTTNSKSHTFTDLPAGASYNVKVMSTMPLETGYSAESQVSLITSTVNKQQIDDLKLITNDSQWQITSKNSETLQASMYSLSGNCIGVYTNQNQISIDRSSFSRGVYLIKVNTSEEKSVFKVIN